MKSKRQGRGVKRAGKGCGINRAGKGVVKVVYGRRFSKMDF